MTMQKTIAKLKKKESSLITFYSYLHSIQNKATLHKGQEKHRLQRLKRPGWKNFICFQIEPYCPMSTFKFTSVSPVKEESPTRRLHVLYS